MKTTTQLVMGPLDFIADDQFCLSIGCALSMQAVHYHSEISGYSRLISEYTAVLFTE